MKKKLAETTREALSSVLPITVIVFLLSMTFSPMPVGTLMLFLFGAVLLIVGMGLFTMGADMSLMTMGEDIGIKMTKTKKVFLIVLISFAMGVIITIAEPDLQVLAEQVSSIPNMTLILTVAIGVGLLLALAILRIFLRIKLSTLLMILYGIVFAVAVFAPPDFLPVAFDSGGVTTGPMTVPFIMAMGVGLASVRSDKDAEDDSFGFVALSSVGPILAVLLLSIFYKPDSAVYEAVDIAQISTTRDVVLEIGRSLPHYAYEVLISIVPVIAVFLVFQLATRRFHRGQFIRMVIGVLYTYLGLTLFLCGVNVGFAPVGSLLGSELASSAVRWLLVPLGMLMGYFIVMAEPAVQVLNKQVEEVTNGAIPGKAMNRSLSIGVAISIGLAMLRILTGIHIFWIIVPGYVLSLILSRIVPQIFVGIAFDSGGVASGPMTATFVLPMCMGVCMALGGNIMEDAFGVVALVAMTPLITIQVLGVVYQLKMRKLSKITEAAESDDILDLEDASDE